MAKREGKWARGERNGRARYTDKRRRAILRMHASGIGYTRLAQLWGMPRASVRRICGAGGARLPKYDSNVATLRA